ncbi:leucine-rich alpha-2-glycoprotein-like [Danio aesculapii]|uniref:leucine-rich alpha-2-glycoprotein-like n=1 Tax=Danio aesculapii TaxID=1142201 RepID=UPI0024BFE677|nr:leucine-rich alpha-2-glycoprotein-like [Danio aesculapii]
MKRSRILAVLLLLQLVIDMNKYNFLTLAVLLSLFSQTQGGVLHQGKCRQVFGNDEVRVICLHVNFKRLPSKVFPGNTTDLRVHFSNLSSISSDDLKIFSQLRHLSLTRNQLQTLPADLLEGLCNLYVLDLTGNKLKALHWRVFGLSPIVELTLADNLLSELHADCLPENSSLQRLDLASNRFARLPVAFLQRLGNLQSLDLKNNQLEELTPGALVSLSKLEALYLENNRLKSLDPSVFIGNPNLQQVFLSGNRLEILPAGLFLQQKELVFLDLRNNSLLNLPTGMLGGRFHAVLSGNPWHCDSGLAYLWHWLRLNGKRIFHDDNITCQTPKHMKGRNISEIAATELGIKENNSLLGNNDC